MESKSPETYAQVLAELQNDLQGHIKSNRLSGATAIAAGISLELMGVIDAIENTGPRGLFVTLGSCVLVYGLVKSSQSADASRKSAVLAAHQFEESSR